MASGQVVQRLFNLFPSHKRMYFTMLGVRKKFKIFKSVIKPVSIFMMNILASRKFPFKMLFHDKPMFSNLSLFSIFHNSEKSIATNCNGTKTTLPTKRYKRISPSLHFGIMTTAKSFCPSDVFAFFYRTLFINFHNGIMVS